MVTARKVHKRRGKGAAGIASLLPGPNAVKVGFPAGEADNDVIMRAIWNHWGTTTIPERPFLTSAMRNNRLAYKTLMVTVARTVIRSVIRGKGAAEAKRAGLGKLGARAQGDIQDEIVSLQSPPNAASTIRQKGSSNPLIDSGELLQSVSWKVEE